MAAPKMWLKRALIPLWVVELIVMGIFFVLGCIVISWSNQADYDDDIQTTVSGAGAIIVAITGLCILLTFIEIGLAAAHKLNPIFHLVSATIKTIIWAIYFILTAAAATSPLDIVLSLLVMLASIGQLVYGSIVMHRVRKGYYTSGNHGAVTYEAENGYKMGSTTEAATVPAPPQYR